MRRPVILLVEDDPDHADLTVQAFARSGVASEVVVVRDGAEALEYLFAEGAHAGRAAPDIVLLDLDVPKVGGLDILRRLRDDERTKLLPVIILTSSRDDEAVATGYQLGANSYIRKPVDFNQFTEAARRLGVYWLGLNRNPITSA